MYSNFSPANKDWLTYGLFEFVDSLICGLVKTSFALFGFVDINEKSVSQSYNTEARIGIFLGLVYDNGSIFGNCLETRGKTSSLLVKAYTTCSSLWGTFIFLILMDKYYWNFGKIWANLENFWAIWQGNPWSLL